MDVALCYGWIDGQAQKLNAEYWIQRYTPRRPKSIWSKKNTLSANRLIKERRMKAPGLAAIESAKKDGRWKDAYDSPKNLKIPKDFLDLLKQDPKAYDFFKSLNRSNLYSISYRLQTAKKPETRLKRIFVILEMMKSGKKFH